MALRGYALLAITTSLPPSPLARLKSENYKTTVYHPHPQGPAQLARRGGRASKDTQTPLPRM